MSGLIQIAGALDISDAQNIIQAGAKEIALPVGSDLRNPELTDHEAKSIFAYLKW